MAGFRSPRTNPPGAPRGGVPASFPGQEPADEGSELYGDPAADDPESETESEEGEGMDIEDLQSYMRSEIEDCIGIAEHRGVLRQKATSYYRGEKYGDETDGRSGVITREVRDTVHAILPSLIRIFLGNEHVAEFIPVGPEDVAEAEQQTDYVHYVFQTDNPGFMVLYSAFKDALIRASGPIKWRWDDGQDHIIDSYEALTVEAAALLVNDAKEIGAHAYVTQRPDNLLDIEIRRFSKQPGIVVEALPPEELLISGTARCLDSARTVAHRTYLTVSDLVRMGVDEEEAEEASGVNEFRQVGEEARRRMPEAAAFSDDSLDPANKPVLYIEAYPKVDFDGDGVAELRKVCMIGPDFKIIHNEPATERPLADFCPDPEPHTAFGNSVADLVMDIQLIKSSILRRILDSLAASINPRTAVVVDQVNMADVLNDETGGVIRMRAPGMVQPLTTPFVGADAFPVLEYMDSLKENRTGISKAAAGLDADALQSATKTAVAATVNAASQHIELIARILAETGLKRMMRGIAKLANRHQDKARTVRLRGKWTQISPASWNADKDVQVNIAVGESSKDQRRAALEMIAQRQEAIIQQYGPENPLVSIGQYRATLGKIIELAGFRDASQFFHEIPADFKLPPKPPQPTPEMLLAQVQAEQIKADTENKKLQIAMDQREMLLKDDRERDKSEGELLLKAWEMGLKYGVQVDLTTLGDIFNRDRQAQTQATLGMAPPMMPPPQQAPPAPQENLNG